MRSASVDAGDIDDGSHLSLVIHDTEVTPLNSLLKLCIGKDNRGTLTTTLKRDVLQVIRSILHNSPASVGTTSKSNLVNVHMSCNSLSGRRTKTGKNIDNASRKTSLLDKVTKVQRRQRSLLGGLEDDCVSAGQSGRDLPCEHHEGEVPGNDLTADSEGFLEDVCEFGGGCFDGLAADLVGGAGVVAEDIVGLVEIASETSAEGLGTRLVRQSIEVETSCLPCRCRRHRWRR